MKTTISDLGYADFSEWFIGHSGSTYWTKKDSEKTGFPSYYRTYVCTETPHLEKAINN